MENTSTAMQDTNGTNDAIWQRILHSVSIAKENLKRQHGCGDLKLEDGVVVWSAFDQQTYLAKLESVENYVRDLSCSSVALDRIVEG